MTAGRVRQSDDDRLLVSPTAQGPAAGRVVGRVPARQRQVDPELHHGARRVGGIQWASAGEWDLGVVRQREALAGQAREVEDDVGSLGGSEEQPRRGAGISGRRFRQAGKHDGPVEEAAVSAYLPNGRPHRAALRVGQPHTKEPGVGAVDDAKAVATRLDIEAGPATPIDRDHIPEELRDPEWVNARVPGRAIHE